MAISTNLGVQSYCFRGFNDNETTAEMVKETGLSGIELCGVHADFQKRDLFENVIKTYTDRGVEIMSTGVNRLSGNEDQDRPFFDFLRAAGAGYMSIDFGTDIIEKGFKDVEKLAEEYDVRLAIHIHGGRHWLGNSDTLRWIYGKTGRRIGLCLDTAWALDSGEDPAAMAREFSDRLHILHLKDFIFDKARRPEDVIIGSGNLDLGALAKVLEQTGFDGISILEYEGDVDNPAPVLKDCVSVIMRAVQDSS